MHDFSNLRFHYLIKHLFSYQGSRLWLAPFLSLGQLVTFSGYLSRAVMLSCVFVSVALDTLHYTLFFALVNTFFHKIINFFLTLYFAFLGAFCGLGYKLSHKGIKSLYGAFKAFLGALWGLSYCQDWQKRAVWACIWAFQGFFWCTCNIAQNTWKQGLSERSGRSGKVCFLWLWEGIRKSFGVLHKHFYDFMQYAHKSWFYLSILLFYDFMTKKLLTN